MITPIDSILRFRGITETSAAEITKKTDYRPIATGTPPKPGDRYYQLTLSREIIPSWVQPDTPLFMPFTEIPGMPASATGRVLASLKGPNGPVPLMSIENDKLVFHISPDDVIAGILHEEYRQEGSRPLPLLIPHYHRIPARLRVEAFKTLVKIKKHFSFPPPFPAWPCEPLVEALRIAVLNAIGEVCGKCIHRTSFWPHNKEWAVALTHDVDTAGGFAAMHEFSSIEQDQGVKACYYIVARGYPVPRKAIMPLYNAGMEIGLHGIFHDNRLAFLPPGELHERFRRSAPFIEGWEMAGFRSPSLLRCETLFRGLQSYFLYDSSVPDTETLTTYPPYSGCATVFPFMRHGILELPLTVPMDSSLIFLGYKPEEIYKIWCDKLAWIKQLGGLAVITTHTDPHFSGNPVMRKIYRRLLAHLREDETAWIAKPVEIARWWIGRDKQNSFQKHQKYSGANLIYSSTPAATTYLTPSQRVGSIADLDVSQTRLRPPIFSNSLICRNLCIFATKLMNRSG